MSMFKARQHREAMARPVREDLGQAPGFFASAAAQDAERNHPSGFVAIAANPLQSQHQQGGAAQHHQQPGDVIKCNCGCECAQVCTPVPV